MRVPASGAVIGLAEKKAMHDAVDAGWLTAGPINAAFEAKLAAFTGIKHVRTCNSGSSANLLAVAAMVASGRWKAGDEIITSAVGFPTTVNPLLLYGLVPVFVDVELGTYNPSVDSIMRGMTYKTAGIMMAHTLGNPYDLPDVGIPVVEDCCDSLGSTVDDIHVGTAAAIATFSFFPAHHITTGEGGAVMTQDADLLRHIEALRDWGRDCWCAPGQNNTCGKRFDQQFGELPYGFDHKYTFTHAGFNLKATEIQAACGLAQIDRLPLFIEKRISNFASISARLEKLQREIILPKGTHGTQPSWFGYPITIRNNDERLALTSHLADKGIDTRLIFGGNLTKQPYMKGRNFRIAEPLINADKVMNDTFWIGVWPGLSEDDLAYVCDTIKEFFA
jgi:CDP-6-deoxy-D-xylo-4-hexulose-3-dehydrase